MAPEPFPAIVSKADQLNQVVIFKQFFGMMAAVLSLCLAFSSHGLAQAHLAGSFATMPSTSKIRSNDRIIAVISISANPGPFSYRWWNSVGRDTAWNPDTTRNTLAINTTRLPLFVPGSTVRIGVHARSLSIDASAEGEFMASFLVNSPPSGGSVNVTPSAGQAYVTTFTITPTGWTDDDGLAGWKYQYGYISGDGRKIALSPVTTVNTWLTTLPPPPSGGGQIDVFVRLYDAFDEYTDATQRVTVSPPEASALPMDTSVFVGLPGLLDTPVDSTVLGVLPVELQRFSIEEHDGTARLSWRTATEYNNFGFDVERKNTHARTWETIGFVEGHGTSSTSHSYGFTDTYVPEGANSFRLKQIDNTGMFSYSNEVEILHRPAAYALGQNYPNPFNPSTTVTFSLPSNSYVTLKIYDVMGRDVATVVDEYLSAGRYTRLWRAPGGSSGVYYCRILAGSFTATKRLTLLR